MMDTKKPQLRGFSAKGLTLNSLCLYSVYARYMISLAKIVPFCHHSCPALQVRLFRSGKQTRSDLNEMTPIADSIPGCGRIKTDIILTCIPGVVLLISNLREILPIWQGSRFVFKKLKEVNK